MKTTCMACGRTDDHDAGDFVNVHDVGWMHRRCRREEIDRTIAAFKRIGEASSRAAFDLRRFAGAARSASVGVRDLARRLRS